MNAGDGLFEYGIHTEVSDVRAHVSVVDKTLYVFPTRNGVRAVEKHKPALLPAYQNGVVGKTAEGWPVKLEWIEDMRRLRFHSWPSWSDFHPTMSTSQKGALAVACVLETMRCGRFPFWIDATEDDRESVQQAGTDILIFARKKVQVKCDYRAGSTGNVFLQKAERNPLRRH